MPMPWLGMPAATMIDSTSFKVSRAARSFGPPTGRSMVMPPVASRFQVCAKARTSARCAGVRPPRPGPTNSSIVRLPSESVMGWRSRGRVAQSRMKP
jgi:hypothetical protein